MTQLWHTTDMVDAMAGRPVGNLPRYVQGLSIDTRTLERGEAFFAIKGERFDGHDFATSAIAAGAGVMVVAEEKLAALGRLKMPMIVVDNVLRALERLAVAARSRSKAQIVAVTGSVGKTSTKEALRHVLTPCGRTHASDRSYNNHWGVPLSLARMPEDSRYAIFEIGMNHANEIRPLARLVRPHIAIVTRIAPAHMGQFNSLEDIALAKAEIFEGIVPGGYALLNRDDPFFASLERLARIAGVDHVLGFGEHPDAVVKLLECQGMAESSQIRVNTAGTESEIRIGVPGRHQVQNALAVLGAAHLAGADMSKVVEAMSTLSAEDGRGKRHRLKHPDGIITLIDESYNANPASMDAAFGLLDTTETAGDGRRIAVLGDMLELGEQSAQMHMALSETVDASRADMVFLAGPLMKPLAEILSPSILSAYCDDVHALEPPLLEAVHAGDVIMIKSSNGTGFSRLIESMKKRFPPVGN